MASLAMALSVAVFVAAPTVAVSQASFSAVSSVKLAPMRFNRHMSVVAMATPAGFKKENFGDKVSQRIEDAQKTCEDDPTSAPCAAAWDNVEELAAYQRDKKKTSGDPVEEYCVENPETDECRVYEDLISLHPALLEYGHMDIG